MAIGFDIGGQALSAALVRDSFDDLLGLLADASKASGAGAQDWIIADLHIGSAVMVVDAADEAPVAALLRSGIDALSRAAEIPVGWNRRMVERVRDMGQRVGRGGATRFAVTGLAGDRVDLTSEIVVNAERALGAASVSYGSFRGTVDRWNEHKKREIGLALDDEGTMTVRYPAALADRVRDQAIGRHIEVWGLVDRNPAGQATGITMEDFEVLPDRDLIPVSSMAGAWTRDDGTPWFTTDEWLAGRGE